MLYNIYKENAVNCVLKRRLTAVGPFSRNKSHICKLDILSNENLEFLKTKIKDVALSSLRYFNLNVPQHLSDIEFQALKNLSRLKKRVIIQKSDKSNSVVLVNKSDYIRHIEGILKDLNKFEKVSLKKGILNFAVNHEEYLKKW